MAQGVYNRMTGKPNSGASGNSGRPNAAIRIDQHHHLRSFGGAAKSEAKPPNEPVAAPHDLPEPVALSTKRNLLDQLRTFGYRLGKRIGEGSYSKVYYAKHIGDNRASTPTPNKPRDHHHHHSHNHNPSGHAHGGRFSHRPTTTTGIAASSQHPYSPRALVPPQPFSVTAADAAAAAAAAAANKTQQQPQQQPQRQQSSNGKPIACKVIDARCTSAEYMDKFLPRELEIIKNLNHPNIVSVYTILEIGPFICCFMDFCAFGDLLDRIRFRGPLSVAETRLYFGQLAAAVAYLHAESIAHRDIKCENVLIQNRYCVKLTDFGFSRPLVCRNAGAIEYSETFCGSAAYAAPEVLKGVPYDPRRYDMWSLGCVLFIMATGSMPYDDENIAATIRRQEQHHIAYPADVPVDEVLRELIARLLEPDVERRLSVEQLMVEPWVNGCGGGDGGSNGNAASG